MAGFTAPLRGGNIFPISTKSQKPAWEETTHKAAQRLRKARYGAQSVARSLSRIERTIAVAPLSFSHEISTAMRESRGMRLAIKLCKRFVLYYLPWFGMIAMVGVVGTVNVFASAKSGGPTLLRSAYAGTIEESVQSQMPPMETSGTNVYANENNSISPSVSAGQGNDLGIGGPVPVEANGSLAESVVYASPSATPPTAFATTSVSNGLSGNRGITTYVVKEGDVPSVIASSYGISLDTLLWANNLKDGDYIRPGDKLTILPVSGVQYKIQRGDTLADIASRFKGDANKILAFNNLKSADALVQGQNLVIPDGQMPVIERKSQSLFTPAYADSSSLKNLGGYFIAPTHGHISQGLHPHNAVDIADSCGTPVYAAAAGKVLIADGTGWNGGYGNYVLIQHPNGVETRYAHATRLVVKSGQEVAQGQLIMYMGETGHATGCHVHFEVLGARNPFAGYRVGSTL